MATSQKVYYQDIIKAAIALQIAVLEDRGEMSTQLSDTETEENILTCAKACNDLAKQYVKQERS